jgi:hypothetical protein
VYKLWLSENQIGPADTLFYRTYTSGPKLEAPVEIYAPLYFVLPNLKTATYFDVIQYYSWPVSTYRLHWFVNRISSPSLAESKKWPYKFNRTNCTPLQDLPRDIRVERVVEKTLYSYHKINDATIQTCQYKTHNLHMENLTLGEFLGALPEQAEVESVVLAPYFEKNGITLSTIDLTGNYPDLFIYGKRKNQDSDLMEEFSENEVVTAALELSSFIFPSPLE